jgi:hypothetical protein
MNIQALLDEKTAKLLILEKYQARAARDLTDGEEELRHETARVTLERADHLTHMQNELSLLQAVPPARDGKDDQRRLRQQWQRPLTDKEIRLMEKKRLTLGQLLVLSNRLFGTARLFEIRTLRQEIRREWERACRDLEREIERQKNMTRPSDLQRTLTIDRSQKERESRQRAEKIALLHVEITSLKTQLFLKP